MKAEIEPGAFITAESGESGYRVVIKCSSIEAMHKAHRAVLEQVYEVSAGVKVPSAWVAAVKRAVDELSIMDESEGVAGFHLNGDVSSWDEGELPSVRDELQALLDELEKEPQS